MVQGFESSQSSSLQDPADVFETEGETVPVADRVGVLVEVIVSDEVRVRLGEREIEGDREAEMEDEGSLDREGSGVEETESVLVVEGSLVGVLDTEIDEVAELENEGEGSS